MLNSRDIEQIFAKGVKLLPEEFKKYMNWNWLLNKNNILKRWENSAQDGWCNAVTLLFF